MKGDIKFAVVLRNKLPYLTKLFGALLIICFVFSFIAYVLYFPSANSGNEMKIVVLFESTSITTKWLMLFSILGLIPCYFLYTKMRLRKDGVLFFEDFSIIFQTKKAIISIPVVNIIRIQFIEPNLNFKWGKQKFIVNIYQFNGEIFQFQLKKYEDSDEVVDLLLSYPELKNRLNDSPTLLISEME